MNKLKKIFDLDNSFYIKKIKDNKHLIVWSIFLALICTFISYPGVWYSDSYSRVSLTDTVLSCGWKVLTGHREEILAQSWITIIPSFFMALCKLLTGNIASYTLLQAFVFFLLTFLFVKELDTPYRKLQYFLFAISPIIYGVSVYYEAGVGCVSGIIMLILVLSSVQKEKTRLDKVIEVLLIILASFITFGYRANAFTIIPVIILYILLSQYKKITKLVILVALIIGILLVYALPVILNINTMSSVSAGFVWEIITVIQRLNPEKQQLYKDYLDEIGGDGATIIAIENSNENSVNGFLWGEGLNTNTLSADGASSKVLKKYVEFIFKEPTTYFSVKWDFTKKSLGIDNNITCAEYDYNRWNAMDKYGFNDCVQREIFVNSYLKINEFLGFYTCRPWVVYLISTILVTIAWFQKDKNRGFYVLLLLLAIFYYGAYIINTQSFELRYFYPSLYIMMILDVALEMKLINQIIHKIKSIEFRKYINDYSSKILKLLKNRGRK